MYNISRAQKGLVVELGIGLPTRYTLRYGAVGEDNLMIDTGTLLKSDQYDNTHIVQIPDLTPATRYMLDGALINEDGRIVETISTIVSTYAEISVTEIKDEILDTSAKFFLSTSVPCKVKVNMMPRDILLYNHDDFTENHELVLNSLRENTNYTFWIRFENENGGELVTHKLVRTRPSVNSESLLTTPYKSIINAIKLVGAKEVLSRINNEIITKPIQNHPLTVPQIMEFSNMVFGLYMDSNGNADKFVRTFAIWMRCDNLTTQLLKVQKLAILQKATTVALDILSAKHKNAIAEQIVEMNNLGLLQQDDAFTQAYKLILGVDLEIKTTIDYESSL